MAWLEERTRSVLDRPYVWLMIEAVAAALLEKETLTGEEAREVCRLVIQDYRPAADQVQITTAVVICHRPESQIAHLDLEGALCGLARLCHAIPKTTSNFLVALAAPG